MDTAALLVSRSEEREGLHAHACVDLLPQLRLTLLAPLVRWQTHGYHPGGDICQVQVKATILKALLLA